VDCNIFKELRFTQKTLNILIGLILKIFLKEAEEAAGTATFSVS
jgi:uncharacterized membrane protein YadS